MTNRSANRSRDTQVCMESVQYCDEEGYMDCPLSAAPTCFRWALVRALELGGDNYLPSNWKGFAEFFRINLEMISALSAQDLVAFWADRHPSHHTNTLHKVFEFAKSSKHQVLLESFSRVLQGKLVLINTPTLYLASFPCLSPIQAGKIRNEATVYIKGK